jgi:signal transduction histidine kinase
MDRRGGRSIADPVRSGIVGLAIRNPKPAKRMSVPASAARSRGSALGGLAAAAAVVAVITLVLFPLSELDPGVSSGVLYVLGVLLVATHWGLRLGLVTSVASALALDYFHTTPSGSILDDEPEDLVAIGVLLLTSIVASVIADRARQRAYESEKRLLLEGELRAREFERIRPREIHASRARVIAAGDRERRRVVRDLHDGAQQRLVHIVVTLKLASEQLADQDPARELVEEALEQAQRATDEVRELAHGILPAALVRGGLRSGVDALASRITLPVSVAVPAIRLSGGAEATAYFVVAEALTNVVKHARADQAWVTIAVQPGWLVVEVRDDGVGGAVREGTGLLGMEDRLAALDGRLTVKSPPGGGTAITASIPLPESARDVAHVGQHGQDAAMLGGRRADV